MIAYCTHCWAEIDSDMTRCPKCGSDLTLDQRSYEEKMLGALTHPLPEARARACWLLGTNRVNTAASRLVEVAEKDEDIFVRHAAVLALGHVKGEGVRAFLEQLSNSEDHMLRAKAREALASASKDADAGKPMA